MAIYRSVQISFWTDTRVVDDFTPEDKYFYLYLMTNPHTNLAGCYEISLRQMSIELGYTKETIESLIERFEQSYELIKYYSSTKEMMILNWRKYNWTKSPKFRKALLDDIQIVKSIIAKNTLMEWYEEYDIDTVSDENGYPMDTSVTVTVTNTNTITDSLSSISKEIIDYLNISINSNYRYNSTKTQGFIKARLNEKFTVDDFKMVIDKKSKEWLGTDMEKYLRPETLFGTKFESYLNQSDAKPVRKNGQRDLFAELEMCE